MFEDWSRDEMNSLFYHVTGIFFKYELDYTLNKSYMTHAIVPINWDDLYTDIYDKYEKCQVQWMWPYFKLERLRNVYKDQDKRYKVFQMWKNTIFYLGQYNRKLIDNDRLFIHIQLPKRTIIYGSNTKDFYNMPRDQIFQLILSNVI